MLQELKILIPAKLDVTEFLDIIGYELSDLVEVLGDEIEEHQEQLMAACKWEALQQEISLA